MVSLGVDFGSSFVRAALFEGGAPQPLTLDVASSELAAVVSIDGVRKLVGSLARSCRSSSRQAVRDAKKRLGRERDDPTAAASLLEHVIGRVRERAGSDPVTAVVGVPGWFSDEQADALSLAGHMAGVERLEFVHEAAATVLANHGATPRIVAVVDVGASGCTASILLSDPRGLRLLSSEPDLSVGGDSVDRAMVARTLHLLSQRFGAYQQTPWERDATWWECANAKQALTHVDVAVAWIPYGRKGVGVCRRPMRVRREHIAALAAPLAQCTANVCRTALEQAGIELDEVSAVYVVGGMSNVPVIAETIQRELGVATSSRVPLGHSVAFGAAVRAAMLEGRATPVHVADGWTRDEAHAKLPVVPALELPRVDAAELRAVTPVALDPDDMFSLDALEASPDSDKPEVARLGPLGFQDDDSFVSTIDAYRDSVQPERCTQLPAPALTAPPRKPGNSHDPAVERAQAICNHLVTTSVVEDRALKVLEHQVASIEHDGFVEQAAEHVCVACSAEVRDVLVSYLERFSNGHERRLGALLPKVDASVSMRLLGVLARMATVDAHEGIAQALRSPFDLVRLQALTCLVTVPGALTWDLLSPLLEDTDEGLRRQALEAVVESGFKEAGLALSRRIRSEAFDRMADWEKQLLFEAAGAVNFRRAEALAITVLEDHRFFSAAHDRSRTIAAEFLSRSDSPSALQALEAHAARRFTNAASVRATAHRSARAVRRRSTLPPAPGESV